MHPSDATQRKLFKEAVIYFPILDQVVAQTSTHRYSFVSDEWFNEQTRAAKLSVAETNYFVALDLLEKSHLVAVTALVRIQRWADAVSIMNETANFLGFAAALRGFLESAGDSVDGLKDVATVLAVNRHTLSQMLGGHLTSAIGDCSSIEAALDHYVHAGFTRDKSPISAAKHNADYVRLIEKGLPGAVSLYHRLCAIAHPSSASIDWMFCTDEQGDNRLQLVANDAAKIEELLDKFPDVANVTMQMACNSALLTLRVLHKFKMHPKIPILKKLNWGQVVTGRELERWLRS